MDRLLTPLLRRTYLFFGAFVACYLVFLGWESSSWNKERLYRKLISGTEPEQASAAFDLGYLQGEEQLLRALKSRSPQVRMAATNSLWDLWAHSAGSAAFKQIQEAHQAVQRRAYTKALQILTGLTEKHPDFPEGWNRRATLYWQMGRLEECITDARKAVALNPNHFGAWQGMALCQVQLGNLEEACLCLRAAIRITPHDHALRRRLTHCEDLLQWFSPGEKIRAETV